MTRYSRSVIPGRQSEGGASLVSEIDNLAFGDKGRAEPVAANDEDEEVSEQESINFVERAASDRRNADRRKGKRRRVSDFAPLPGEAAHRAATQAGSRRGPILLGSALVVVAVFGAVVWNAYREGVRPEDSAAAPMIGEDGAFKSKPDTAEAKNAKDEATVFEQVEARPAVSPAPEVREEAAAPTIKTPETKTPEIKVAETKPVETKPAASKPGAPVLAPVTQASVTPTVGRSTMTVGAAKPADLPVVGGASSKTAAAQPVASRPQAPKPAATLASAAAEAPIQLVGPAPGAPAFSAQGKFVVQIAAPDSEAGAAAEWKKAAKKAPALFASAEQIVMKAEVKGQTVYRVRAGSFATGADADAFCNAFKASGGSCFRAAK